MTNGKKCAVFLSFSYGRIIGLIYALLASFSLDSPANYVVGLTKLFQQAQLLDEHTKALLASPPSPLYSSLSLDIRQALEIKLKRSSEFFASVVLTFVVRDLSQLLDKYVKKGEKWLAE